MIRNKRENTTNGFLAPAIHKSKMNSSDANVVLVCIIIRLPAVNCIILIEVRQQLGRP